MSPLEPDKVIEVSETLQAVNHLLWEGDRDLENTCVFDVRPFRSDCGRRKELDGVEEENDELAYDVVKQMLELLQPQIFVACQYQTDSSKNPVAKILCSAVGKCENTKTLPLDNPLATIVYAFHPSYSGENYYLDEYAKPKRLTGKQRKDRKNAFKALIHLAFLTVFNASFG